MSFYDVLLFVHLVAAMLWIGGALVGMLVGEAIYKSGDAAAMGAFCKGFATVAGPVFGGSSLLVVVSGTWMVAGTEGLDFGAAWISIGFAGWFVSMVMGATIVGRSWLNLGRKLAAEGTKIESTTQDFFHARLWTWIDLAIRFAVVAVMVVRPA